MKIYTRSGDQGQTSLFGGARVAKNDARVEAYGTLDELNASLGVARSFPLSPVADQLLEKIQAELFTLGSELACDPEALPRLKIALLDEEAVSFLERSIDELELGLPQLRYFILPTGAPAGAHLHLARTICRRAERRLLALQTVRPLTIIYLNRLSDFLFVLARHENHQQETPETPWSAKKSP